MKYRINISNLSFDFELENLEDLNESVKAAVATAIASSLPADLGAQSRQLEIPSGQFIALEDFNYDWERAVQHIQNTDV